MRKLKKALALILALAMVLSMTMTVSFAEEVETESTDPVSNEGIETLDETETPGGGETPEEPGEGGGEPPAGGGEPPAGGGGPGGPGGGGSWTYGEDVKETLTLWVKDDVVVAPNTEGAVSYEVERIVTGSEDNISSFNGGGHTAEDDDYAFVYAIYVNGSGEEVVVKIYEAAIAVGDEDGEYKEDANGVTITSEYEGFNPIIVVDADYNIVGATIAINSQGDGTKTCDFSGLGAAIAVYGDSLVTIEDSKIDVSGVANLCLFADDGCDVIIKNSDLYSDGGTLYETYRNSPDQATMVAPPWILGIMGSSRTTNLMGNDSSTTVIDSYVAAAQWALLSTDSGQNMKLNVVNTKMELLGADYPLQQGGVFKTETGDTGITSNPYTKRSGYGTYAIGNADEYFYGVDMIVGTYATIFTGGFGTYTALEKGQPISLKDANGNELTTYTPAEDKVTTINSDTFGFMIHQGTNEITIEKGTVVNSDYTSFLLKSGCSVDAHITSGSVINPGNGIIIQAMDNDDATTGMDVSTFSFYTEHKENAGWPEDNFELGDNSGDFTFTDVTLVGDIFNGSGWVLNGNTTNMGRPLTSTALNIVLDGKTTLRGQVSSTATIHVTKEGSDAIKAAAVKTSEDWVDYQNTYFTIANYYDIGHVANKVASAGQNPVNVTIEDDAVWTVTADGIVNNVTASSDAIVADEAVTLTVEGTLILDGEVVMVNTTVGNVTYDVGRDYVTLGSFNSKAAAPRWAAVENASGEVTIVDSIAWHNGVVFDKAGTYTLSGTITMETKADGSDTNDFSGLGAAIMVNGCDPDDNPAREAVIAYIEDAKVTTYGVAKLALFTDGGAVSIVKNSEMSAYGGVIYDGYMSTADQSVMVSPPWVLGLGGNAEEPCNARTTNLMGNYSVAAYVDSYFYAKGWGALSVDSGTNMNMVVVNSDIDVETSGYGAYNIGESLETYYGSTMDVSTYGIIMTGGEATFQSYTGGDEIEVRQFSAEDELKLTSQGMGGRTSGLIADPETAGTVVATVVSDKVAEGTTKASKVIADDFGFMMHANGSNNWNVLNILDGTEVESGDAIFLVKKVNAQINVDEAVLSSTEKNTLVQIIDNDDDYVGLDFAAQWGEDNEYGHAYGMHMPTFNSKFHEDAGYSNEWIAETSAAGQADYDVAKNWVVEYNMTNTVAEGDLWNSTGYVGKNPATTMQVNLGEGAELTGTISAGAFSHDIKDATVGDGDWTEAAALGHVTNIVNSNGVNLVNVTLTDDAKWNVTGDGVVNNVTASSKAIVADEAVTITVEGTLTLDGKVVTVNTTVDNVTYDVGVESTPDAPSTGEDVKTGDNAMPVVVASVALLAVIAFVVLFVQKKKA